MEELATPQTKQVFTLSPQFTKFYANHLKLSGQVFDFSITFGEQRSDPLAAQPPGDITVEEHATVTLSWPHAKLMALFVVSRVLGYELSRETLQKS
jgi:hypothetical protein